VAGLPGVRLVGRANTVAEVVGNGAELNRALTNLLVNAIRHTAPDGTVEITRRAVGDASRTTAEVTVREECGSIAADDPARVFEVGLRGEPARTPHPDLGGGTSLGLAAHGAS
jgi:signal transduction histidine kinase